MVQGPISTERPEASSLPPEQAALSDANLDALFVRARWPDGIVCPHCRSDAFYRLRTVARRRCANRECRRDFTTLSGSLLASSKLSLLDIWAVVSLYARDPYNSGGRISRATGVTQKSVYILSRKLDEMLDLKDPPSDAFILLRMALQAPPSPGYVGYWQQTAAKTENMGLASLYQP